MTPTLYLTGGQARKDAEKKQEWQQYQHAIIATLDLSTGELKQRVQYISPDDVVADEQPSILFKSAQLNDHKLLTCTQTEVIEYDIHDFEPSSYLSHPLMNDVHHAIRAHDQLWVASTGLDMALTFDQQHQLLDAHYALDGDPWERFDQNKDYRKVLTTKPHLAHPNHLAATSNGMWLTRFEQRDAINLLDRSQVIDIQIERPHDGFRVGEHLYFTTVNGFIIKTDASTQKTLEVINLNTICQSNKALGWCRGLCVVDDIAVVGFSKLRTTKIKDNLRWLRHQIKLSDHAGTLPSRIMAIDLKQLTPLWERPIQTVGLDAIFSVLPNQAVTEASLRNAATSD